MRNIEKLERQVGILNLLLTLLENGELASSELSFKSGVYWRPMLKSLEKLKEMHLINTRIDKSTYPHKNLISLSDKGKRVAQFLQNIDSELGED